MFGDTRCEVIAQLSATPLGLIAMWIFDPENLLTVGTRRIFKSLREQYGIDDCPSVLLKSYVGDASVLECVPLIMLWTGLGADGAGWELQIAG